MKIIIFGHQNWGIETIKALKKEHLILHVFTHPLDMDKHEKVWYKSLTEICQENKIPVTERTKIEKNDQDKIAKMNPDLIISAGWRRLIPDNNSKLIISAFLKSIKIFPFMCSIISLAIERPRPV